MPTSLAWLDRFDDPAPEYGPLPIWWWSGARLTRPRLRWQMAQMVAGGIRQAVVMCLAPTGPLFGCLAAPRPPPPGGDSAPTTGRNRGLWSDAFRRPIHQHLQA